MITRPKIRPGAVAALRTVLLASLSVALVLLALAAPADAQQPAPAEVAEAAADVAQQARGAFERIDPDSEMAASADEAAALYAGLPPLAGEAEATPARLTEGLAPAPRLPAVRMIPGDAAQKSTAPAAAPPAAAPAPAPQPVANRRSADPFVIKSILPIEGSLRYGEWYWDESAAPATGKLVITVDLEARVISAFRDGHEIGTAVALLGTPAHPTPTGTFPILTKEKDNVSEKYDNAPMPWTLRLTWDGIAIHGSPVTNGYASHGCVGVPDPFAEKLFAAARRGDRVIITRGRMVGPGDKLL